LICSVLLTDLWFRADDMNQMFAARRSGQMGEVEEEVERRGLVQEEPAEFVERRQHKRYAVDGMAEVLVADGTMLFRGRVLDISVAGCFIETEARLRLQRETPVEMVFRVNGVVFRVLATSRMVCPGKGAGFLFSNLNARMQAGLEALIAVLSGQAM
jgi:PilZ domain